MQALFADGHAAAQSKFGNVEAAIFFQVGGGGRDRAFETQARVTALANGRRILIHVERLDGKFGNAQAAARHEVTHPFGINFLHSLRSDQAELAGAGPTEGAARLGDFAQDGFGARGAQAAERFDSFELQIFGSVLGQVAFGDAQQTHIGNAISGHADFIHGERTNQRIEKIKKIEKQAAAIGSTAGGDLPDDAILRRALPLGNALGKNLFDQIGVKAREDTQRFDGFGGSAIAENLTQILETFEIENLHHRDQQVAIFAEAGAIESSGEMNGSRDGHAAQQIFQARRRFAGFQSLFDEFGKAIFDADSGAKIFAEAGAFCFDVFNEFDSALDRGIG